jgi:hypothetical protein
MTQLLVLMLTSRWKFVSSFIGAYSYPMNRAIDLYRFDAAQKLKVAAIMLLALP